MWAPKTISQLSEATGCRADRLRRTINVMRHHGLVYAAGTAARGDGQRGSCAQLWGWQAVPFERSES
jgi:hypothetical protein